MSSNTKTLYDTCKNNNIELIKMYYLCKPRLLFIMSFKVKITAFFRSPCDFLFYFFFLKIASPNVKKKNKMTLVGDQDMYHEMLKYSRLSLSRIPRDSLKYFEISVVRHIRFAELRKK